MGVTPPVSFLLLEMERRWLHEGYMSAVDDLCGNHGGEPLDAVAPAALLWFDSLRWVPSGCGPRLRPQPDLLLGDTPKNVCGLLAERFVGSSDAERRDLLARRIWNVLLAMRIEVGRP